MSAKNEVGYLHQVRHAELQSTVLLLCIPTVNYVRENCTRKLNFFLQHIFQHNVTINNVKGNVFLHLFNLLYGTLTPRNCNNFVVSLWKMNVDS